MFLWYRERINSEADHDITDEVKRQEEELEKEEAEEMLG